MVNNRRKFKNALIAVFATSALFISGVAKQVSAEPLENDSELQFAAGFFHTQSASTGSANVDAAYGYFLTKQLELGLRAAYTGAYNDKARDEWLVTTAPFLDFNFTGLTDRDMIVPFIGGEVGGIWNDKDGSGIVGPEAGIKWYFTPQTSLIARYRYEWAFKDTDVGEDRSRGNHTVTVGFGFNWGGSGQRGKY